MAKLKPGDEVLCRTNKSLIVSNECLEYDQERIFEIIATDSRGYFLYVPEYYNLDGASEITAQNIRVLGILSKYVGGKFIYVDASYISKIRKIIDGCLCAVCGEFYQYAESNQEDGTFKCWLCRTYR